VIRRGEIWWADLPNPAGSGPGFRRPVLIVQADSFNASAIQTTIAVVLTSELRRARAPGNLLLKKRHSRLHKDSVVNVSQTVTLDKTLLTERISRLPDRLLAEVDKGLRLVLDLL